MPGHESHRLSTAALVSASLLPAELPSSTQTQRLAAIRYVEDSIDAMPDSTRWGVRLVGTGVYLVLSVLCGRSFGRAAEDRRSLMARRLLGLPLPLVSEYARLTRGLALVGAIEHPTDPADAA
jgi:hypothetical protein